MKLERRSARLLSTSSFVGARSQGLIGLDTEPPTKSVVESSQFGPYLSLFATSRPAIERQQALKFDQGRGRYFRRRCCRILESLATFCFPLPQAPSNSPCRQGTPAKRTTALDHASIRHPRAPPHGLFLINVFVVKESDFSGDYVPSITHSSYVIVLDWVHTIEILDTVHEFAKKGMRLDATAERHGFSARSR
jgi:hypothetical protein